jgi:hypothetical protein
MKRIDKAPMQKDQPTDAAPAPSERLLTVPQAAARRRSESDQPGGELCFDAREWGLVINA